MEAKATTAAGLGNLDAPADVLAFARRERVAADRAEARLLQAAVVWADQHPAESLEAAEVLRTCGYAGGFGDSAVPVAGPGAPLVAEFSIAEFAAAVGLSTEAGKRYVGHALELRYRLPRLWKRVTSGDLPAWKARRVAEQTISHALTPEAAAYVDRHVGAGRAQDRRRGDRPAGRGGDRPVHARDRRGDPPPRRRRAALHHRPRPGLLRRHLADPRRAGPRRRPRPGPGDRAVIADQLKDLGCTEPLDVRRSVAAGDLARRQLALDLQPGDAEDPQD